MKKIHWGVFLAGVHFGRLGGIVPDPEEIVSALKEKLIEK